MAGIWPFRRRRGRALFRSHELAVLDGVRAALPQDAARQLDRQVDAVERVSRLFKGEDVAFGPNGLGLERFDRALAFANRSLEYKLARLELRGATRAGTASVTAVVGHVVSIDFRPGPAALGRRDSIVVTKTTLRLDPSQPDRGDATQRRLEELDPAVRLELEQAWSRRPGWATSLLEAGGLYPIDLDDGAFVVLAQLDDTTFVVAGIDPARPGVRRHEPSGELVGEFGTIEEAFTAGPATGS